MNNCIDCKKEIDNRSKRCQPCYHKYSIGKINNKGNYNPNFKYDISYNFLYEEYINKKKSMKEIANLINCERQTIRRKLLDYKIPIRIRGKFFKGRPKTKEHKEKIKLSNIGKHNMFGKNNPMFGKKARNSKGVWYKNKYFRSSYEILYAKYLDKNHIKWLYEPKRFNLGDSTYAPDFYLPENDTYIEIKGWWRDNAKIKFDLFRKLYSNVKIKVLMKKDLKLFNIL